jgi:hypothetical protein
VISGVPGLGRDLGKQRKGLLLKRSSLVVGLQGPVGIGKTHTAQVLLRLTPCPSFSLYNTALLKQWLAALPKPKALELWAEWNSAGGKRAGATMFQFSLERSPQVKLRIHQPRLFSPRASNLQLQYAPTPWYTWHFAGWADVQPIWPAPLN